MSEQKKGTQKETGNTTEKTVHDLTKQEDLTRILDQSLRALQEMEQRLQVLEQEIGSIGSRPSHASQRIQPGPSRSQGEYIGAPNPHGFQEPPVDPAYAAQFSTPQAFWNPARMGVNPAWANQQGAPQAGDPSTLFTLQALHQSGAGNPHNPSPFSPFAQQSFAAPQPGLFGMGASSAPAGNENTTGAPGGVGGPVSAALQVGDPGIMQAGGTRTKDFSEMTPQVRQPSMDVVDCNSEFLIHWELPGVKKENLDIMVTDKSLILNAKSFPELDDGIVVHSERPPVVYRRTIPFQTEVDTGKAKANLKDGVLTIHVPKQSPSSGPKRLDVAYG